MSVLDDLLAASDAPTVLRHVARGEWAKARDGAECPDARIPTPEAMLAWRVPMPVLDAAMSVARAAAGITGPPVPVPVETAALPFGDSLYWLGLVVDALALPIGRGADVATHHAAWCALPEPRPRHWLAPLVAAWQRWKEAQGDPPDRVHVIVTRERRPPLKAEPLTLARTPGLLALMQTPLEAIEVEGEPLATATPASRGPRRLYRVAAPGQGELWPAPRTIAGHSTGGALIEMAAQAPLGGDERSPLRADLIRVGTLAYALTSSMRLTTGELSILVTGQDTPSGREQGLRLAWTMRGAAVWVGGEPWSAFDAEVGEHHRIGAPRWWLDNAGNGPRAYRLTGALLRRIPGEGRKAARWGVLERTLAGIEGALLWGPSAGKGRSGRTPDAVRAVRRGGPGAPVTVAWYHLLRLAGEHVTPERLADPAKNATMRQRFNRRIDALLAAGYMVGEHGAAAPAGDTIEIGRRIKGGRHHEAAIVVRATARFCAAYARGGERTELPASHLLTPALPSH